MYIIILGGINDKNGILSDYTKKRVEKCYEMLGNDKNNQNNIYTFFGRF